MCGGGGGGEPSELIIEVNDELLYEIPAEYKFLILI